MILQNAKRDCTFRADIQFPQGSPGSNPGSGVLIFLTFKYSNSNILIMAFFTSKSPKQEAEANLIGSALDADRKISESLRAIEKEMFALKTYMSFFDRKTTEAQLKDSQKIYNSLKEARDIHQKGILTKRPR